MTSRNLISLMTRRWKGEQGVAAIEFALILPFMVMMFMGMIEISIRFAESRKAALVAGMVGDLVAQNDDETIQKSEIEDYFVVVRKTMLPFDNNKVRVRVALFHSADGKQIRVRWRTSYGNLPASKCPPIRLSDLPSEIKQTIKANRIGMVVTRACKEHDALFTKFFTMNLKDKLLFKHDSFFRPRYVNNLKCQGC